MIRIAPDWEDYRIVATGDGEKLEKWGQYTLLRPDPQVIWRASRPLKDYNYDARYLRSETGGGHWEYKKALPEIWHIKWRELTFAVRPMGFKHTGLFPEQAANCREISVLNLFGYTGGATAACLKAGASVCHVDAAKNMVDLCGENLRLSGLEKAPVRYIVDDCRKFVTREIKRGHKYDAIIMDPPSYGRGAGGEIWKLEKDIYDFVELTADVLSDKPLFVLINSYTTGLQPQVLSNILNRALGRKGKIESYEVGLPTDEKGIILPCGASGLFIGE
jgi:23S rRNA (cytosine1962-C5)-methyltransferase